jgi:PPOX class probable F420-dependent enzyme
MPQMTREEAFAFLGFGTRTGKLATSGPGGPHVAPVWFVVAGDDIVFTTAESSVKGRNLRADPRAALSVDLEIFPYSFVVVRGRVWLAPSPPEMLEWSTRIAARYVPADKATWYGERNAVPGEYLCRLHVDRLVAESDIAV